MPYSIALTVFFFRSKINMESSFIISAASQKQFPEHPYSEIGLMGKSNCGKSSLVNALLQRKKLAYRSATPGSTVMINFYKVSAGDKGVFILADMPGYGYSKTNKAVSKGWNDLMEAFFNRGCLRKVFFLIDIRRKIEDFEIKYLKYLYKLGVQLTVILTKNDKVKKSEIHKAMNQMKKVLETEGKMTKLNFHSISSLKGTGVKDLQDSLFS